MVTEVDRNQVWPIYLLCNRWIGLFVSFEGGKELDQQWNQYPMGQLILHTTDQTREGDADQGMIAPIGWLSTKISA
jgi:hypothetical protein